MRILDNRYSRDLRRHDLALRMIHHEVRTLTIKTWTGLSDTRIRSLFRSYLPQSGKATLRHRGPAPTRVEPILRSKRLSGEAAGLVGLCIAVGALPAKPDPNAARELPTISSGERLCYAFELYQQMVPKPQISLDQLVLLVGALAQRVEVALRHCDRCDAAMLVGLLHKPSRTCSRCKAAGAPSASSRVPSESHSRPPEAETEEQNSPSDSLKGYQRPLF